MLPGSPQGLPRTRPEPPKTFQDAVKTSPRRLMAFSDAPKACPRHNQDMPRLPKTPQDLPKMPPRPLQSLIFDSLRSVKLQLFDDFPEHAALQASKHPNHPAP